MWKNFALKIMPLDGFVIILWILKEGFNCAGTQCNIIHPWMLHRVRLNNVPFKSYHLLPMKLSFQITSFIGTADVTSTTAFQTQYTSFKHYMMRNASNAGTQGTFGVTVEHKYILIAGATWYTLTYLRTMAWKALNSHLRRLQSGTAEMSHCIWHFWEWGLSWRGWNGKLKLFISDQWPIYPINELTGIQKQLFMWAVF